MDAQDKWYPAKDSNGQVVGRFFRGEALDKEKSLAEDREIMKPVTMLGTRIIGSTDYSTQIVKPHNEKEFRLRFPEAWIAFQGGIPEVIGTPVKEMGFGADDVAKLQIQGIMSVEQLASASDGVCQNLGFGWRNHRRRAEEFLTGKINAVQRAEQPLPPSGPSVDDLQKQIEELKAKLAAPPSPAPAPEPLAAADSETSPPDAPARRGWPKGKSRKPAEAAAA